MIIKGKQAYYFHSQVAQLVVDAIDQNMGEITISLNLNKSKSTYRILGNTLLIDENIHIDKDLLLPIIKKENRAFIFESNELYPIEFRDEHYYKLVPTEYAPTFEISGVKMHRSKDYDPFIDAKEKASEVVKVGHKVLDTCGGLGYTAIWSILLGAQEVVSVERSQSVQQLRALNPWSEGLNDKRIKAISGDVAEIINKLDDNYFDAIIHDPPRFSLSGYLYSEEFYCELYRVLKKGGGLFHYTGNPYLAKRGDTFLLNSAKRLKESGFKKVLPKPEFLGVLALKI